LTSSQKEKCVRLERLSILPAFCPFLGRRFYQQVSERRVKRERLQIQTVTADEVNRWGAAATSLRSGCRLPRRGRVHQRCWFWICGPALHI
jgi:hypothetical protein